MELLPDPQPKPLSLEPKPAVRPARFPAHPAGRVLLCLFIVAVTAAGVMLRNWTWHATAPIHFQEDISNASFWGGQTLLEGRRLAPAKPPADTWEGFFEGYISLYDYSNAFPGRVYPLDYAPLRLLIMSLWVKYEGLPRPGVNGDIFKSAGPLLLFNLLCEFAAAAAIFLLVRTCLVRSIATTRPGWFRRRSPRGHIWFCSLAAASVAWLEPSMILDAHAWPQWDVWIMPCYLFAALAMAHGRWMLCGSLLAIGAMMKPQILITAPFFILVPLWTLQWRQALHLLAGFGITIAFIALPWLVTGAEGCIYITEGVLLCVAIFVVRKKAEHMGGTWGIIKNIKPRETFFWCCLVLSAVILLSAWQGGGDFAWLRAGFQHTAETSPSLAEQPVWCNLPALLAAKGWALKDKIPRLDALGLHTLTLQLALKLAYLAALLPVSFAAARHLRNRDPKLLVTIALPWLLMFALIGQMHSRYLMWGAVASALSFGVNIRLSLLHFPLSVLSAAMILDRLITNKNPPQFSATLHTIHTMKPYGAYIVLGCVTVYLLDSLLLRSRPAGNREVQLVSGLNNE